MFLQLLTDPLEIVEIKPHLGQTFRYFLPNSGILLSVTKLCQLIGKYSDLSVISDICLELLKSSSQLKEALLLFSLVLSG